MAEPPLVLVHSPLLGPSSWRPVANELRMRGRTVVAPNLLDALASSPGNYHRALAATVHAAVRADLDEPPALVVHSGAGELVPSLVEGSAPPVAAVVFVDASLPHPGHTWFESVPPELGELVRQLVEPDGLLRPWQEWFPAGMLDDLIPDGRARAELYGDIPRVPPRYFEERAPTLASWLRVPAGYLQLSTGYADAADEARARTWPVRVLDGHHLSTVTDPAAVATATLALLDHLS